MLYEIWCIVVQPGIFPLLSEDIEDRPDKFYFLIPPRAELDLGIFAALQESYYIRRHRIEVSGSAKPLGQRGLARCPSHGT